MVTGEVVTSSIFVYRLYSKDELAQGRLEDWVLVDLEEERCWEMGDPSEGK